jgi:hypothetical protein
MYHFFLILSILKKSSTKGDRSTPLGYNPMLKKQPVKRQLKDPKTWFSA